LFWEGIPGDSVFTLTYDSNLESALPASLLSTQDLPSAWVSQFTSRITLTNYALHIEVGSRWRVDDGSGKHIFIEEEPAMRT